MEGSFDRMSDTQFRKELLSTLRDTNKILMAIGQAIAERGGADPADLALAALMGERQVSGVRSAGGDGGVEVQRYPLPNKAWIIARRFPDGKEDVTFEDRDGNRRPITPDEAEELLLGN